MNRFSFSLPCLAATLSVGFFLTSCGKSERPGSSRVNAKGSGGFVAKAPVSGVDASEARTALVIGVSKYEDKYFQSLQAPEQDARKIADKLTSLGFEVTLILNPRRAEMTAAIDDFGTVLTRRQGVGLFYFSGHGGMNPDEQDPNFLIPSGTDIATRQDLPQAAVNAQRVANRMKEASNRLNLVFLDACRSNTLPSRGKAGAGGLASMRGAGGLMFFFATQPSEVALEAVETRSSLFTDALLEHMSAPGLSFLDMMGEVTASTETASLALTAEMEHPFKQTPFMTGSLSGRFSFVPSTLTSVISSGLSEEEVQRRIDAAVKAAAVVSRPPPSAPVSAPEPSGSVLDHPGIGKSAEMPLLGGIKVTLQSIPKGSFTMGSPASEADRSEDEKQVRVTLSRDFWLARTEFTQAQWKAVMGTNPSRFKGDDLPVEQVSWNNVQECLFALNSKTGLPVGWTWALPTEAQWEYACRAGTTTPFSSGKTLSSPEANFDGNSPYGTTRKGASLGKTTAVGSYPANAWGLHDMHGNVWEWCQDAWDGKSFLPGGTDPLGSTGSDRVGRGGSWGGGGRGCRSAYRNGGEPAGRDVILGFRLAAVPAESR